MDVAPAAVPVPAVRVDISRCNGEVLSRIGDGDGKIAAGAVGTLLGTLVDGSIGRSMDEADQACVGHALEHGGPGGSFSWRNPASGGEYTVVPAAAAGDGNGGACRTYTMTGVIDGRGETLQGRACRSPDGTWTRVR